MKRRYLLLLKILPATITVMLLGSLYFVIRQPSASDPQLEIGMPRSIVIQRLGRSPDLEYLFQSFSIVYISSNSRMMRRINPTEKEPFPSNYLRPIKTSEIGYLHPGMEIDSLHDLPDLYGYYQLAFDGNDLLVAHILIGESYTVKYVNGAVRGTHLSAVPELLETSEGN